MVFFSLHIWLSRVNWFYSEIWIQKKILRRTRSRRWRWCCRQEDPCSINVTPKTSYLLVPPTKHSRLIFSFFSAIKVPQEQPLEYFALINLSKMNAPNLIYFYCTGFSMLIRGSFFACSDIENTVVCRWFYTHILQSLWYKSLKFWDPSKQYSLVYSW